MKKQNTNTPTQLNDQFEYDLPTNNTQHGCDVSSTEKEMEQEINDYDEQLYHEFGYDLPDGDDQELIRLFEDSHVYPEPTYIDKLRNKISNMPRWQVMLLFGCVITADICLTMLAIYLHNLFN